MSVLFVTPLTAIFVQECCRSWYVVALIFRTLFSFLWKVTRYRENTSGRRERSRIRFPVFSCAFTRSSSRIESHRLILFSCLPLRSTAPDVTWRSTTSNHFERCHTFLFASIFFYAWSRMRDRTVITWMRQSSVNSVTFESFDLCD